MKEADIRPKALFDEYLRLSAADVARFFPDPDEFEVRPCPACAEPGANAAFTKTRFEYVRCASCDTLYARRIPPPTAFAAFYRDSPSTKYWAETFFPAVAEVRRGLIFRPRAERVFELTARANQTPTWLDIGSGVGLMLEEARALRPGLVGRAVEPSASMAATCRAKGFETFEGFSQEAARDANWRGSADIVTSFEVLEHLDDVVGFLASARDLAKPGGLIIMSGLCGDGFDIRVLGARSNSVSPPHHITFLSERGARRAVERAGLEIIEFLTPGKLDVDIVRNAALADPGVLADSFLKDLILGPRDEARAAFQTFLAANRLSSHMWFLAQRPDG